ncbi:glycerate kinase [Thermoproteota archaeon]
MIKNRIQLIENSSNDVFRKLRSDVSDILESALQAVDPEQAVLNALKVEADILVYDGDSIDLSQVDNLFVIGGGKAGGLMANALESLLESRISSGIVNVLEGTENSVSLNHIVLNGASHPIPSEKGIAGVKQMMELTSQLSPRDLVITLISGGGSALMPYPVEEVTLDDLQEITRELMRAGATINELNAVRKHLSSIKGGQLAQHCSPARVVSLIMSDVIGDPLDTIASGLTAPDESTFTDAYTVLEKYRLFKNSPSTIRERIMNGVNSNVPETPKKSDPVFNRVHNVLIANNSTACIAAMSKAEELGYNSLILSTSIEGEARIVGASLAEKAKEILETARPIERPTAVILGGETTVTVKGKGVGGRNQELSLGGLDKIAGLSSLVASLGTDGIDGPTEAAGALIDGYSLERSKKLGLSPDEYLNNNDSYNFFRQLGDVIITGPTGTNVNDIVIILVV